MAKWSTKRLQQLPCGQHGVALLAAVILMLAVVLTMSSIFYRHQVDVARLTKMLHGDQALLLGLSAEAWAIQTLQEDDDSVDSFEEEWAVTVPLLPVEGGFIRACMIDMQSKINLNSLASYDTSRWSTEMNGEQYGQAETLLELLRSAELPATVTQVASIIDWIDPDFEPLNQWGAEQNEYDANRAELMVPNSLLTEVGELSVINGFSSEMVQLLEPWLSVLPVVTAININTASEQVLFALGGQHSQVFAEYVLDARPFNNIDDFRLDIGGFLSLSAEQTILQWPEDLVSVKTDFFLLSMHVSLGEAKLEIHSLISRYGRDAPVVIRRNVAVIPNILPDTETTSFDSFEDISQDSFCQYSSGSI